MKSTHVINALDQKSDPKRARQCTRYFKTGKGHYGFGDVFIGVTVPEQREIAEQFFDISLSEIKKLLTSKIHEYRFTALEILVMKFEKATSVEKKKIVDFYLAHTKYINNWDLVDTSAPYILGNHLSDKPRNILYKLAKSKNLWERRIAIVATSVFIQQDDFKDTLKISELLLSDKHDLIHKAVGWMLREVGKKDMNVLRKFLDTHIKQIPRTTLRYAIEKMNKTERKKYLKL